MLSAWGMFGDFHTWCSEMAEVSYLDLYFNFITVIKRVMCATVSLDGIFMNIKCYSVSPALMFLSLSLHSLCCWPFWVLFILEIMIVCFFFLFSIESANHSIFVDVLFCIRVYLVTGNSKEYSLLSWSYSFFHLNLHYVYAVGETVREWFVYLLCFFLVSWRCYEYMC